MDKQNILDEVKKLKDIVKATSSSHEVLVTEYELSKLYRLLGEIAYNEYEMGLI